MRTSNIQDRTSNIEGIRRQWRKSNSNARSVHDDELSLLLAALTGATTTQTNPPTVLSQHKSPPREAMRETSTPDELVETPRDLTVTARGQLSRTTLPSAFPPIATRAQEQQQPFSEQGPVAEYNSAIPYPSQPTTTDDPWNSRPAPAVNQNSASQELTTATPGDVQIGIQQSWFTPHVDQPDDSTSEPFPSPDLSAALADLRHDLDGREQEQLAERQRQARARRACYR